MGFTVTEVKSFAFMKAFLYNDIADLMNIVNENLVFSYQYHDVPYELSDILSETVRFDYQGSEFFALKVKKTPQIIILTNLPNKRLLTDSYLIAQKLFQQIKLSELEKKISTITLRGFFNNDGILNLNKVLTSDQIRRLKGFYDVNLFLENERDMFRFKQTDAEEDDISHFMGVHTTLRLDNNFRETINKQINIRWGDSSVFTGKKKIFTLPILGCNQSNLSEVVGGLNLNGLSINWWLKSDRIYKIIRNDNVPVSKVDFERLVDFKITRDKVVNGIRTTNILNKLKNFPSKSQLFNRNIINNIVENRFLRGTQLFFGSVNENNNKTKDKETTKTLDEQVLEMQREMEMLNQEMLGGPSFAFEDMEMPEQITDEINENINEDGGNFTLNFDMDDFNIDPSSLIDEEETENAASMSFNDEQLQVANIMSQMESEMETLDFSDVKFYEVDVDSDDGDLRDIERINREQSEESSDHSNERYLEFSEFQNMVPKLAEQDVVFSSSQSHTYKLLERIGDPSMKIIDQFYTAKSVLSQCTTKEKVGVLYRCNDLLVNINHLSDVELYLTMTLLKDVLETFEDRDEWTISDDFVMKESDDGSYTIYLKQTGQIDLPDIASFKEKGGIIVEGKDDKNTYYIPLTKKRLLEVLDMTTDSMAIDKFVNTKPLEECYYRLYSEPFKRHGFASKLINELFDW
jgi:hypothetical protein